MRPGTRRAAGVLRGAALALAAIGLPLGLAGPARAAAPAPETDAAQCTVGTTRYTTQPSYVLNSLGILKTWPLATGRGQVVAVVDSGVDTRNAHLQGGVVLPGKSFVPGPATADGQGHGTAVAGIIAGQVLPGRSSLYGVAPEARILPVRVYLNESGTGGEHVPYPPDTARLAEGIRWAADHGADVINVSLGVPATNAELPVLRSAVEFAIHRKHAVVVASSGNTDGSDTTALQYPAAFPGVIGVAAADDRGVVDQWSLHGPQVDVSAPGGNVLVAFFANGDCLAGTDHPYTSWAAPFVSGLAAQLRQRFPHESVARIAYRIMASADRPRRGERDDVQGWGEIRPYAALTMTLDPRRAGPPLPGHHEAAAPRPQADLSPLAARPDPREPVRRQALWWGLGAVGAAALALVLRPLTARRRR